jgi:hypothetical protein
MTVKSNLKALIRKASNSFTEVRMFVKKEGPLTEALWRSRN